MMCGSAIRKLADLRTTPIGRLGGVAQSAALGLPAPLVDKLDAKYTANVVHDFPTDEEVQKKNAADLAAQTLATDTAATNAANTALLARKRRLAGSALSTGANTGGGSLSSAMAYGKSTLGG